MGRRRNATVMAWEKAKRLALLLFAVSLVWRVAPGWSEELSGAALVQSRCAVCHAPQRGDKLEAIESARKTPEGWEMTLDRMIRTHGLRLQPTDGAQLVKYLSDCYGLAPAEVAPYQHVLEKRINAVAQVDLPKTVQGACVQCHSYARIALQRRTADSWKRVPDMKLALITNTENVTASSGLLSNYWYDDATKEAIPYIVKQFPFTSEAWTKWQIAAKPDYAGTWKVVGHDPGKGGDYTGELTLSALGGDRYEGAFTHRFSDGSTVSGKTTAIVYTGFQWRGIAQLEGGQKQQEIFFGSENGALLSGRRLSTGLGDLGMDEKLYRKKDIARLLTIMPAALKAGDTQKVRLFATSFPANLPESALQFGEGVKVQAITRSSDDTIVAEVTTKKDVKIGARQIKVSGMQGDATLQVYAAVDYIRIAPEQGFARPGGVKARKVMEQFEAIGYLNGPDGVKGTKDDIKVGRVAPVKWDVEENVTHNNDDDIQFVGKIDENGLFTPAEDGPNTKRERMEHNVGDVWVEAWYTPDGAKRPMGARAPLLVMPEKFSFQPIE
ncbi:MAG: quinohemoprotein amine dehydrogenase subunit alpha [Deltaproteobacteria bacterium]|nr:quinohemoprotein amine dehydrogenase subunit alpha [Deltaproteobacteria bacterium]